LLAKKRISSTDLIWIFRERLSSYPDCPASIKIAIVPSKGSFTVVTAPSDRKAHPRCIWHIAQIEKELRAIYVLVKD
jgi:hypothetical protein